MFNSRNPLASTVKGVPAKEKKLLQNKVRNFTELIRPFNVVMMQIGHIKPIRGDDWTIVAGAESVLVSAVLRFDDRIAYSQKYTPVLALARPPTSSLLNTFRGQSRRGTSR
jgi:hypothetical protein